MPTSKPNESFKTIDDYEAFLSKTLASWSPQRRVALAAAMAQRWLPVYVEFSAREQWGDPVSLRQTLAAVWAHAAGDPLRPADRARREAALLDVTPHMDDFDDLAAMAACVVLSDALDCCKTDDNATFAVRAALSAFEAAVPDWVFESEDQPRLWRQIAARKELRKQLAVVEKVAALSRFDDEAIVALRSELTAPDLVGEASDLPAAAEPAPGLSNQMAFEQYREQVESQLRSPAYSPPANTPYLVGMSIFSQWGARYLKRLQTITGKDGKLADEAAVAALVARRRALDPAEAESPNWNPEVRQVMSLCLANPLTGYDVRSLDEPHAYGPSLRRMWMEAKRRGDSDDQAWKSIIAWARHRPAAWDEEDRRKKKGLAVAETLSQHLAQQVAWRVTDDLQHPWAAEVAGQRWRVRLNDFPDEIMYSLLIGDDVIGEFHDWPETWVR